MKKILVIANRKKPKALAAERRLAGYLRRRGHRVIRFHEGLSIQNPDFAVALGGDGTMLYAARRLAPEGIALLGVNLGDLGFLAATAPARMLQAVSRVLAGRFSVESRAMLTASLFRGKRASARDFLALNDIVIKNGLTQRVIELDLHANGQFVFRTIGDGLILATPTGSTAYALASGGPILHPQTPAFVVAPLSPHSLAQRPLVLSDETLLRVEVKGDEPDVVLTADGQESMRLRIGDRVEIKKADFSLNLIHPSPQRYFETLHKKLKR